MVAWLWLVIGGAAIVGVGTFLGSWAQGTVSHALQDRGVDPEVRRGLASTVQPLAVAVAAIVALAWVGVDTTILVALMTVAAATAGYAAHPTLVNVAAGAFVLTVRPFRTGDFVEIGDERGMVLETSLLVTTLRTQDGAIVSLPSRLVAGRPIRNHTRHGSQRVDIVVWLGPEADVDRSIEALHAVIVADARILPEPAPVVRARDLHGDTLEIVGTGWTRSSDAVDVKSDLLRAARNALGKPTNG